MKKITVRYVERVEEEFAAAAPSEAGALARKLNKLKKKLVRGE